MNSNTTPEWVDTEAYPFHGKYLQVNGGKMHYLDEGKGQPMVMIHGTPTWSFLYREMIKYFREDYRCIVPDHIGFGLSDKPEKWSYTPEAHAENLRKLFAHLSLDNIILIVHDFGGPIGLSYAIQNPEKIEKLILFNTWLWSLNEDPSVRKAAKIASGPIGRFLYRYLNFSAKVLIRQGFSDKSLITSNLHKQYTSPFNSRSERSGTIGFAEALLGSGEWYEILWQRREQLKQIHMQLLWGTEDNFLQPHMLDRWKKAFPAARVEEFQTGHFIQEEKPDEVNHAIRDFLGQTE